MVYLPILCVLCVCVLKSSPHSGKVDPPAVAQVTVTMTAAAFISGCMRGCSPIRKLMDTRYIQEPDLDRTHASIFNLLNRAHTRFLIGSPAPHLWTSTLLSTDQLCSCYTLLISIHATVRRNGFIVKTGLYLSYRPANGLSMMHTALLFLVAFPTYGSNCTPSCRRRAISLWIASNFPNVKVSGDSFFKAHWDVK